MIANILDIRQFKENTLETLNAAIQLAVKDTQRVLIRELPNQIKMTPAQYDLLQSDSDLKGDYDTKDKLYRTPMNVMEVVIDFSS